MKIIGLNPSLIKINIIPPINPHFHAMIRKMIKAIEGMRGIRKATIYCHSVFSRLKASSVYILINRIAIRVTTPTAITYTSCCSQLFTPSKFLKRYINRGISDMICIVANSLLCYS